MTTPPIASPAEAYQTYYGPAIFEPLATLLLARGRPMPGENVLDVACGTGIVTRRVHDAVGPTGRVTGVDRNPAMLEVARVSSHGGSRPIVWREGDGEDLDLPTAGFDLVCCQQGLQFFADRAAGVAEMHRVLRPRGRAVIAVWQGLERHPLFAALAEAEVPHLTARDIPVTIEDATAPFSLGEADELYALLHGAGFSSVNVHEASIVARFPDPDRFVERLEYAYAAVIPAFMEDPDLFTSYLESIRQDTRRIVGRYRDGDHVAVPMHTNIAVARP